MSLDGLRAWIGEVERKLGVRTRVFLALAAIAIGGAGAAIYLALDARDSVVDKADLEAVQEQLEAQQSAGGAAGATSEVSQLEAEIDALRSEFDQLRSEDETQAQPPGGKGTPDKDTEGLESGPGAGSAGTSVDGGGASAEKLKELVEEAK